MGAIDQLLMCAEGLCCADNRCALGGLVCLVLWRRFPAKLPTRPPIAVGVVNIACCECKHTVLHSLYISPECLCYSL